MSAPDSGGCLSSLAIVLLVVTWSWRWEIAMERLCLCCAGTVDGILVSIRSVNTLGITTGIFDDDCSDGIL